jgi:hypothetical protein
MHSESLRMRVLITVVTAVTVWRQRVETQRVETAYGDTECGDTACRCEDTAVTVC